MNNLVQRFAILGVTFYLVSCTNIAKVEMPASGLDRLGAETIVVAKPQKSEMAVASLGLALLPFFAGIPGMYATGNAIVADNDVLNPAAIVTSHLVEELRAKQGLRLSLSDTVVDNDDFQQLARRFAPSNYVMYVRTLDWALVPRFPGQSELRMGYAASLTIADLKNNLVLVRARCARSGFDTSYPGATVESYTANNAAKLKEVLNSIAVDCALSFVRGVHSTKTARLVARRGTLRITPSLRRRNT